MVIDCRPIAKQWKEEMKQEIANFSGNNTPSLCVFMAIVGIISKMDVVAKVSETTLKQISYTPTPHGTGVLTVCSLLENTIKAFKNNHME